MGLKDLELPKSDVQISDNAKIVVRGLSSSDFSKLINKFGPTLVSLFDTLKDRFDGGDIDGEDIATVAQLALQAAPDLVAEVIALAADEPDQVEAAKRLRVSVQIEALEKILNLTFTSEAEVKKSVEIVTGWLQKINGSAQGIKHSLSSVGFGESESK